ncbi:GNAT family N-acetyltransferase [Siculibacillus lacustris]|uniref:GNAT family N-acetyltransferase n=1 Tax=Siculibacillus lacustris TaxID=1549641 RepID=A0A4Q9VIX7_9HYPH|nr:arsenic resistance N-acetyltransferase ArsN2 [Siculibacillus lacustris]TBW34286.1 GNAT family N-acetyltransferase [Siculibacillus lacustris]
MSAALVAILPDDPAFTAALAAEGLPTADLGEADRRFFALSDGAAPRAWIGIEGSGEDRLLRSLVVPPQGRRSGAARAAVAAAERLAAADGARRLWLLTTTAAAVFDRLGWVRRPRAEAPASIAATGQFATLCPASAVLMSRELAP